MKSLSDKVIVTVKFGPKVRKITSIIMAQEALRVSGGDRNKAYDLVNSDPTFVTDMVQKAIQMVARMKMTHDCPHGDDDEAIAQDILDHMDTSILTTPPPEDCPVCEHCGFIH